MDLTIIFILSALSYCAYLILVYVVNNANKIRRASDNIITRHQD